MRVEQAVMVGIEVPQRQRGRISRCRRQRLLRKPSFALTAPVPAQLLICYQNQFVSGDVADFSRIAANPQSQANDLHYGPVPMLQ
ncbi:hypothetical protein [Cupriavidus sp. PET2-C1]